ncbi:MAG TPA: hypothetical protein VFF81_14810 [Noviherbaspirillum sp.]|nr:hypothetical protein [Noviherbaspirillum sp.]
MGDEQQPALRKMMDDYHTSQRPRHHALHDAHSLRLAFRHAVEHGWRPSFGGDAAKAAAERAAQVIGEGLRMAIGLKGSLTAHIESEDDAIKAVLSDGFGKRPLI